MIKRLKQLDSWLFARGEPHTLGLLRIVFGAITVAVLSIQLPFLLDYYGSSGLLPREALKLWQWRWLPEPLSTLSNTQMMVAFYALLVVAVTTTLGLYTRISSILLFLGMMFFHNRNPLILNSGDTLLRLVLLYLAISGCGKAYSLDNWLRAKRNSLTSATPTLVSLFPQRLIQIQIALIYFAAIWHKAQGPLWREGTVTWYVSRIEELNRFPLPDLLMSEWAAHLTTWGTLGVQLCLCTLVWFKPYRNWVLLLGVMLHLGIEYKLNIPFFGLITVSCYIAFFSAEEIKHFLSRMGLVKG